VSVSDKRIEVDVIPYGGVEEPDRSVHLPNDHRLNVLGVREAFDAADTVLLPGGLEVRVPTIPGLALLKIIAWYDRRFLSKRDATDLDGIINWYSDGPFLDDLLEEADILDVYDFDIVLAAAHRLGRHIGLIAGHEGRAAVLAGLDDEDLRARLTSDMGRATTGHSMRLLALADGIRCSQGDEARSCCGAPPSDAGTPAEGFGMGRSSSTARDHTVGGRSPGERRTAS
jgi:predicted nucleotidyltransferase